MSKKSNNKKRQFKCEVCGATFYNFDNYFKHQQHCRQWEIKGIKAINKALEMLKCTFQDTFEVVKNNAKYQIIQDEEKIAYPAEMIDMDITCKFKGKEFQLYNYIFNSSNYTNATSIYFLIMQHYILPIMAGFNSLEEYEYSKLSKEDQELAKQYIEMWKEVE